MAFHSVAETVGRSIRMKPIFTHRIIELALAAIFTVFNVGLPVVVASCPMMKYSGSLACVACDDGSAAGTLRFTNFVDKSCCETKYAADKNKNEFLKTNGQSVETLKFISAAELYVVLQVVINSPQFVLHANTSPPGSFDIPILISSLLI